MDLPNILNTKGAQAAAAAGADPSFHHFTQLQNGQATPYSDTGSDRGGSPSMSTIGLKFERQAQPPHLMSNLPHMASYPQPNSRMMPTSYPTPQNSSESIYQPQPQQPSHQQTDNMTPQQTQTPDNATPPQQPVKAFSCSTCQKGFARRSDLARHERIHSGIRPHVCEHPGCGKQFIQRSALTVHARVHTGEKPHMCEHCTKPFSDSSSLARHRRIHSGKRPYKCPYADCQKTFTRRTTLTRHQNHHTGTVEEAAAATAAALANRPAVNQTIGRTRSEEDGSANFSDAGSAQSAPSPSTHRPISISPNSGEMPQLPMLPRAYSDFQHMTTSLPPHLRNDFGAAAHSPRSSPGSTSPALTGTGYQNGAPAAHSRPPITSHPQMYGPPHPLEPPTQHEQRNPGSATASPQLSSMGWPQSPMHQPGGGSPMYAQQMYADPSAQYGVSAPQPGMYYAPAPTSNMHPAHGGQMRRTNSTEPDQYETKPSARMMGVGDAGWGQHMG